MSEAVTDFLRRREANAVAEAEQWEETHGGAPDTEVDTLYASLTAYTVARRLGFTVDEARALQVGLHAKLRGNAQRRQAPDAVALARSLGYDDADMTGWP